jgi:formylglycine-generating enzyme required for sulfatase activity
MKRFMRYVPTVGLAVAAGVMLSVLVLHQPEPAIAAPFEPTIDKPTHEKYSEKIPGSEVSFEMVAIPGGTYLMGSPESEKGRAADEGPQHPVRVKPFWMGSRPVTWDEYDLYWKQRKDVNKDKWTDNDKLADAVTRPTPPYADETFGYGREGNPVMCITHHAAMEYCRWLSAKTGKVYRLPTEAEWEFAARAGTTTAYFFGDDPDKLGDYAWYGKNCKGAEEGPHPVGKKKASPWGLYDICGNVAQWCLDSYEKDFYTKSPADKLSLCPVSMPTDRRFPDVARGGSWYDKEPAKCRSAARRSSDSSWIKRDPQSPQSIWWLTDADYVGFRVVRPVEEYENLKGIKSKVTKQSD